MWFSFVVGAFIPVFPWIITPRFDVALAGSVGGGLIGIAGISVYQARGKSQFLCRILMRQMIITTLAVALTIFFDNCFA